MKTLEEIRQEYNSIARIEIEATDKIAMRSLQEDIDNASNEDKTYFEVNSYYTKSKRPEIIDLRKGY